MPVKKKPNKADLPEKPDPPDVRKTKKEDGTLVVQVHHPQAKTDIICSVCHIKITHGKPYTYYAYIKDKKVIKKEYLCDRCEEQLWENS